MSAGKERKEYVSSMYDSRTERKEKERKKENREMKGHLSYPNKTHSSFNAS